MGVSVLLGVGATALVGPAPPTLADAPVTGDADLAARAVEALGPEGVRALSVAVVDTTAPPPEQVRLAAVGTTAGAGSPPVDPGTPFETGSVAKALDGLLLADMVDRGEVRLDERVGDLVPGSPLAADGEATLQELATHRSGLPRLPRSALLPALMSRYSGGDPYSGAPADLLEDAAGAGAPGGAEPEYSNLGAAVLGQALAERAGRPWPDLLAERVLDPVGMTSTSVATTPAEVPVEGAEPVRANGSEVEPWTAAGWAPAGVGPWSTAEDLARLATALLEASAPGARALEPVTEHSEDREIGLHWIVSSETAGDGGEHVVTWHNGGTAGSRTFVGLDRQRGRAVVVLASTDRSVDAAAVELLLQGATRA
ncbi:serine hydrolase [uncultured Pseudokineococcus sp.]|uniref:serine hydrolase domain-containing protein n=1 Tax=uncultured Pseudokineococcus sp. TaxID=1642928 RepID=UPI002608C31F|nr:serine hydrolase domain-containing protein [uncultured Pseudokineococcus sp.]